MLESKTAEHDWIPHFRFFRKTRRARAFVGTTPESGRLQLEILRSEGLTPQSRVLEVGCGALHLAGPLIRFVQPGHYAGIDPNEWLRSQALSKSRMRRLVRRRKPVFLTRDDFDASELGMSFDFVFAHSVLSHAAHWQLDQFLKNAVKVLAPGGRIVASVRLAEGNEFGSPGSPTKTDSLDREWVYPGTSFFTRATIQQVAETCNLQVRFEPKYTSAYVAKRPEEYHDWIVLEGI